MHEEDAKPEPRRAWSIVARSANGDSFVAAELTLEQARAAYRRLAQTPTPPASREVFGPADWDRSEISQWDGAAAAE